MMEQLLSQEQLQGMPDAEVMKSLLQGYQGQFGELPEGIEVRAVRSAPRGEREGARSQQTAAW